MKGAVAFWLIAPMRGCKVGLTGAAVTAGSYVLCLRYTMIPIQRANWIPVVMIDENCSK